jgi:hypothetical protein
LIGEEVQNAALEFIGLMVERDGQLALGNFPQRIDPRASASIHQA